VTEDLATVHELPPCEDMLDVLESLTRNHALAFRLEVGRVLLNAFFGGDGGAYQSHDRPRPHPAGAARVADRSGRSRLPATPPRSSAAAVEPARTAGRLRGVGEARGEASADRAAGARRVDTLQQLG
jgi:hypothetical protein